MGGWEGQMNLPYLAKFSCRNISAKPGIIVNDGLYSAFVEDDIFEFRPSFLLSQNHRPEDERLRAPSDELAIAMKAETIIRPIASTLISQKVGSDTFNRFRKGLSSMCQEK